MKDPVILSAVRTPIGKFQGALKTVTATQLGSLVVRAAVERAKLSPEQIDEVIRILHARLLSAEASLPKSPH
jgi:acetyl-CoA C-acetyltransferase